MDYTPKTWQAGEAGGTPITGSELNRIEQGIEDAETEIDTLTAPQVVSNFKLSNTAKLRASLAKAIRGTGYSTHVSPRAGTSPSKSSPHRNSVTSGLCLSATGR